MSSATLRAPERVVPELPEVETVVRDLKDAGLVGRRITGIDIRWSRSVAEPAPALFRKRLIGRQVTAVERRAKYIVMTLDDARLLLIHLRMTGRLDLTAGPTGSAPHEHVLLALDDGRVLRFKDTRKFGRWYLVESPAERLESLGPEPLSRALKPEAFVTRLRQRRRMLKPLLLDQTFLAGLGNIYVDEALWLARLHPCRRAHNVTRREAAQLFDAIRTVLRKGIRAMGTTLGTGETNFYSVAGRRGRNSDRLNVFRRHGMPCPRCHTALIRMSVGQRATHICPACQKHR